MSKIPPGYIWWSGSSNAGDLGAPKHDLISRVFVQYPCLIDHVPLYNDYFLGSPKTHSSYLSVQQIPILEESQLRAAEKFAEVKKFQCQQGIEPNFELTKFILSRLDIWRKQMIDCYQ